MVARARRGHALPKPCGGGFTLLEILIVIAIIGLIAALGLFISMDVYRGFLHRSERDTIVSLLERARSHAMANIGGSAWGFCALGGNYVVFRGTDYPTGTVETSVATSSALVTNIPYCGPNPGDVIVFAQLSGTTTPATISVQQGAAPAATITINDHGTILW